MASPIAWFSVAFAFAVICLYSSATNSVRSILLIPTPRVIKELELVESLQIENHPPVSTDFGMSENQLRKTVAG